MALSAALVAVAESPSAVSTDTVEWGTVPQTPIATTTSGPKVQVCGSHAALLHFARRTFSCLANIFMSNVTIDVGPRLDILAPRLARHRRQRGPTAVSIEAAEAENQRARAASHFIATGVA
jgi:hypothetical protein